MTPYLQAGARRSSCSRVAEEDEVLGLFRQVPLALRLHLQKGEQRPDLLLDRLQTDERIELLLQLGHRPQGWAAETGRRSIPPGRAPLVVSDSRSPSTLTLG